MAIAIEPYKTCTECYQRTDVECGKCGQAKCLDCRTTVTVDGKAVWLCDDCIETW